MVTKSSSGNIFDLIFEKKNFFRHLEKTKMKKNMKNRRLNSSSHYMSKYLILGIYEMLYDRRNKNMI